MITHYNKWDFYLYFQREAFPNGIAATMTTPLTKI